LLVGENRIHVCIYSTLMRVVSYLPPNSSNNRAELHHQPKVRIDTVGLGLFTAPPDPIWRISDLLWLAANQSALPWSADLAASRSISRQSVFRLQPTAEQDGTAWYKESICRHGSGRSI